MIPLDRKTPFGRFLRAWNATIKKDFFYICLLPNRPYHGGHADLRLGTFGPSEPKEITEYDI